MTGYRSKPKVYKLVFADPEFEGLVVRVLSPRLGTMLDMQRFTRVRKILTTDEDIEQWENALKTLSEHMVDWNLEDDNGEPVPTTPEGFKTQDSDFMYEIVLAWIRAIAGISGPLERTSSDGEPSPEESIPMEPLSPSPES